MGVKLIVTLVSVFFILVLLFFYFFPVKTFSFESYSKNSNFSSFAELDGGMQFYSNMRFPELNISYQILDCPLKKQNEMQFAFEIMENLTTLEFYPVTSNQEISVYCEDKERIENGLFIGGEGGPTNMSAIGDFAVIFGGRILLIRESNCPKPNIALHELLHVLGFKHSENSRNIMYFITDCEQTLGEDTIQLINELYAIPSYPDLIFENVSAKINGRFLDIDIVIMNAGLKDSEDFKINIYAGENFIKEFEVEPIDKGYGRLVNLKNLWVSQVNVRELKLIIESNFNEISKENNQIQLALKDD